MKRFLNFRSLCFVLAVLCSTGVLFSYSSDDLIQFDALFPKNELVKAIEECTKVWGSLERLQKISQVSKDSIRLLDSSIGQLVLAQRFLNVRKEISADHAHYLARLVGTIDHYCNRLFQIKIDDDRIECLQEQIHKLKSMIEPNLGR